MGILVSELRGQILLRIGAGVVTPEVSVRIGEIDTYMAYAINYVQTGNYWLETRAEGVKTINPLMLTTFDNIPIVYNTLNERYYSDLTKDVISIPNGRALEITTVCGKKCWPLTQGEEALEQYYGKLKKNISYQLEGQRRVWFYNLPPLIKFIRPKYIVQVSDLQDSDQIILPSDGEVKVIEMTVAFLLGQRKEPKDYTEDGKDK